MRVRKETLDAGQWHRMPRETTPPDFVDSSIEWRRVFSEIWGTFLLVVVAAGAGVVAAKSGGAVTPGMAVVAPGLMVMSVIYFMGTVSGAHLNPAVTFAFAVRRNFPWRRVPGYILGQVAGEDADLTAFRQIAGGAPQEIVLQFGSAGMFEAEHLAALWIDTAHHVPDGAVLPAASIAWNISSNA